MKSIFLTLTVFFAFAMTSFAQLNPGPGGTSLPGLPDPVDLIISDFNIPNSSQAGSPITFTFTVTNLIEGFVPAHETGFYISNSANLPEYVVVTIPSMQLGQTSQIITVNYTHSSGPSLQNTPGIVFWINYIEANAFNTVIEANGNNNLNNNTYPFTITIF